MIYLERHEPDNNVHRFYALQVSRDLFGRWVLTRAWGRAGAAKGQKIINSFEREEEAEVALQSLWRAKLKRGYRHLNGVWPYNLKTHSPFAAGVTLP